MNDNITDHTTGNILIVSIGAISISKCTEFDENNSWDNCIHQIILSQIDFCLNTESLTESQHSNQISSNRSLLRYLFSSGLLTS